MSNTAVILLAGCGRRISSHYRGIHKALIPLNGEPLLKYLLKNLASAGITDVVPVLGYQGEILLSAIEAYGTRFNSITPVFNPEYSRTNNLGSILCTEPILSGKEFSVINGDMVFDYHILEDTVSIKGNVIAADFGDYGYQLDSPRLLVENGRVLDIGRHRSIADSQGYAVGIYKFSEEFSEEYFSLGNKKLEQDPNAGYHDVLIGILDRVLFVPASTNNYRWMDVDEPSDVPKAEAMLRRV